MLRSEFYPVLFVSFAFVFAFIILTPCPVSAQDRLMQQELEEVMAYVYDSNPTLSAARAELEATEELDPQARAGWLPSLRGEASLYTTDIDSSNFSRGDGATTKDLTLSLDQPIWRGGRTFAEADRAADLIAAGQATLKQAEQDILFSVVTAYMNVVRDRQLLMLRKRSEDLFAREWRATRERFAIGALTETDVQQTKARLAKAESLRIAATRNLYISDAEYEEIVGMKVPVNMMFPLARLDLPQDIDDMTAMAEDRNTELQIASYRFQAAEHDVDAVFRELWPQISAFASMNKQYDPQPGIIPESRTDTIGLRASIDLFRGGEVRSRIREARASAKKQRFGIEQVRRRIRQQVRRNWRSYQAAIQQTRATKLEIIAASDALEGVREEARFGQRTVLDILDSDEDLIEAEVSLARARRDEIVAKYALARTMGLPFIAMMDNDSASDHKEIATK